MAAYSRVEQFTGDAEGTDVANELDAVATAVNNVEADQITTGAVGTSELAATAVTTSKIADDAVTTAKIADGAVKASLSSNMVKYAVGYRYEGITQVIGDVLAAVTTNGADAFSESITVASGDQVVVTAYYRIDTVSGAAVADADYIETGINFTLGGDTQDSTVIHPYSSGSLIRGGHTEVYVAGSAGTLTIDLEIAKRSTVAAANMGVVILNIQHITA